MIQVGYEHRFEYSYAEQDGERYPILRLELGHPTAGGRVAVDGYLDNGCSRSLFDGRLAMAIGLDPTRGTRVSCVSAAGLGLTAVLSVVRLRHPLLGDFQLEVGFTQIHLARNLLGRDFLAHVQLGLREHRQEFYLTASP